MKKILVTLIFVFLIISSVPAQTRAVYEHSGSFRQIADRYEKRVVDTSSQFKYYAYSVETKELPVLNEQEKKMVGKDNFVVFWLSGLNNDINFLFLCNYEANEAIIFSFRKENVDGYKPYSADGIKNDIFYLYLSMYLDAKWIGDE